MRAEPVGFAARPARRAAARTVGSSVAGHRLGEQPERADRRLQLVAHVGDEVAPHALDPVDLRDVVHERHRADDCAVADERERPAAGASSAAGRRAGARARDASPSPRLSSSRADGAARRPRRRAARPGTARPPRCGTPRCRPRRPRRRPRPTRASAAASRSRWVANAGRERAASAACRSGGGRRPVSRRGLMACSAGCEVTPVTVLREQACPTRPSVRSVEGAPVRFRLFPRDDGFYPLFDDAAENVAECARRLRDLLDHYADDTGHGPATPRRREARQPDRRLRVARRRDHPHDPAAASTRASSRRSTARTSTRSPRSSTTWSTTC